MERSSARTCFFLPITPTIHPILKARAAVDARVVSASEEDVQSAVHNANEVFKSGIWSRAPAVQRAVVLSNLARDLEERVPELAKIESLQTGRAIREMKAQVRPYLEVVGGSKLMG